MAWAFHAPDCVIPARCHDTISDFWVRQTNWVLAPSLTYWLRHLKYVTTSRAWLIYPWNEDKDSKIVLGVKWDIANTWLFGCFFWQCHAACAILVHWSGLEPVPLHWKCRVLTSGPHGKSFFFFPLRYSYVLFQLYYYRSAISVTTKWLLNEWTKY